MWQKWAKPACILRYLQVSRHKSKCWENEQTGKDNVGGERKESEEELQFAKIYDDRNVT